LVAVNSLWPLVRCGDIKVHDSVCS
jgi:hypothetical protein